MAAKTKTTYTEVNPVDFIHSFADNQQKIAESLHLVELFRKWSGFDARMWGPSIIGFGNYHYKYPSGHEGDAPLLGFSPRKAALSLYVYYPSAETDLLLKDLGKYKMGAACIYVKKLADIQLPVLEQLCKASISAVCRDYKCG
jgi:hypothetical protein